MPPSREAVSPGPALGRTGAASPRAGSGGAEIRHGPQQFDAVALGDREHFLNRRRAIRREPRGTAGEPLHRPAGCMHLEGNRVLGRFVANGVRGASGQRHGFTGTRDASNGAAIGLTEIEGELTGQHTVDLTRRMAVHNRRPATGWHPQLDGEEISVRLRGSGEHGRQFGADTQNVSSWLIIDR